MHRSTLVVIRAHQENGHLWENLSYLRKRTDCDVKILFHEPGHRTADTEDVIYFDEHAVNELGISTFSNPQWAWFMGDCAAYIALDRHTKYDHLMMLDYDVKINFEIPEFFDACVGRFDFVAAYAGFEPTKWVWADAAANWFPKVRGSFFPLVCLSRRLSDAGRAKRIQISQCWLDGGSRKADVSRSMVNCEAFLPSLCATLNFDQIDIQKVVPNWNYDYFTSFRLFPWEATQLDAIAAIHPCFPIKDLPTFFRKAMLSNHVADWAKDKLRSDLEKLISDGFHLERADFADI